MLRLTSSYIEVLIMNVKYVPRGQSNARPASPMSKKGGTVEHHVLSNLDGRTNDIFYIVLPISPGKNFFLCLNG